MLYEVSACVLVRVIQAWYMQTPLRTPSEVVRLSLGYMPTAPDLYNKCQIKHTVIKMLKY